MKRNKMRQKRIDEFLVPAPTSRRVEHAASSPSGPLDGFLQRNILQLAAPTLEVFHRFKDLPPELRIKIWKIASFVQRNIDIQNKELYMSDDFDCGEPDFVPHVIFTTRPPPAILHTCQESRTEGLKYYTLEFGTTLSRRLCTVTTPAKIYVNWAVDRLCLMQPVSLNDFHTELETSPSRVEELFGIMAEKGLKYLAVNVCCSDEVSTFTPSGYPMEYPIYCELLPQKGSVQELILFDDQRWEKWGTVELDNPVVFKRVGNVWAEENCSLLTAMQDVRYYFFHSPLGHFDDKTLKWFRSIKIKLRKT